MKGLRANGQYSVRLREFIEEWSNEVSYSKLSKLLAQLTGSEILTASGVQSYIERKAECISESWVCGSNPAEQTIAVSASIDVYDATSKEVVVMIDDVGVKAQKPHKKVAREAEDAKRIDTTVALVQSSETCYEYCTEGIDKSGTIIYPITQSIVDSLARHHDTKVALPIVAITDGARSIRLTLEAMFGAHVCIILDWYHLQHKVQNLMSMIAINKPDKELYIKEIGALLWLGKVSDCLEYIDKLPEVKNASKRDELRDYISKHRKEIINYGLRQEAGKTIGSGRGEKANDQIVAHRQKKKGMAWSRVGSKALAIIKTSRLNNLKLAA
jgi:hypothetical protein